MDRRSVLRAIGGTSLGVFAGCPGMGDTDPPNAVEMSLIEEPSVDAVHDTRIDVDLMHEPASEHPASLRFIVENERDDQRRYSYGEEFPITGKSTPLGLVIVGGVPTEDPPREGCWSTTLDEWIMVGFDAFIDGGAARVTELSLWDSARTAGCYPPGEFRFEDELDVYDSETERSTIEWGFTVEVSA